MLVLPDKNTIFFDCDDTLVMWDQLNEKNIAEAIRIPDPYKDDTILLLPHKYHIKQLMEHKKNGHVVVVWTQGGAPWAEAVVKALHLEEYVDVCMSKPHWYYDDLPSPVFMGANIWYDENGRHMNPHKVITDDD